MSAAAPAHHRREDLDRPRRDPGPGRAGGPRGRPPPRPRGHQPAGVLRPARRAASASAARTRRWRRPTTRSRRRARSLPILDAMAARPGQPARGELRRVRDPAPRHRRPGAGHRPRHRAAARPDPAGHDHRVRRLAHEHARRVRGARVRDRDERGRDGPRHPDAAPARPEDLRGPGRRPADAGRQRQGHHPRPDRRGSGSAAGPATSSSTPATRSAA